MFFTNFEKCKCYSLLCLTLAEILTETLFLQMPEIYLKYYYKNLGNWEYWKFFTMSTILCMKEWNWCFYFYKLTYLLIGVQRYYVTGPFCSSRKSVQYFDNVGINKKDLWARTYRTFTESFNVEQIYALFNK